ncbi:YqeB family protein [Streptomyces sp. 4N509B]|uniref:YqeB family protein n=1 Tax=Streptomyces sp. 4N509B TaxID=3457413 RepID=UPI003FD44625
MNPRDDHPDDDGRRDGRDPGDERHDEHHPASPTSGPAPAPASPASAAAESTDATELGLSLADRVLLIVGGPLLGAVLGILLPPLAGWLLGLSWVPEHGLLRLVDSWDGVVAPALLGLGGLLLGLVLAGLAIASTMRVTLTDEWIEIRRSDDRRTIPRGEVDAVFVDGKKLVVLDRESRQLLRETSEADTATIARAFAAHGYPYVKRDPYEDIFRRWVPDTPELPGAVNALLKAREAALKKKAADDAAELHDEVQKLGFVVRDGKSARQYWRPLVRP